jgi:hypothetical protein
VPMKPGDERLLDLAAFEPPAAPEFVQPQATFRNPRGPLPGGGRSNGRRPFRPREASPSEGGSRRHNNWGNNRRNNAAPSR